MSYCRHNRINFYNFVSITHNDSLPPTSFPSAFQDVPVDIYLQRVLPVVALRQVAKRGLHLLLPVETDLLGALPIPDDDVPRGVGAEAVRLARHPQPAVEHRDLRAQDAAGRGYDVLVQLVTPGG